MIKCISWMNWRSVLNQKVCVNPKPILRKVSSHLWCLKVQWKAAALEKRFGYPKYWPDPIPEP